MMNIIVILQMIIVVIIVVFIILVLRQINVNKKIKRISPYALEPLNDNSLSFSDKLWCKYLVFVRKLGNKFKKSKFIVKRSKRYEKYIKYSNRDKIEATDFIVHKLVIASIFILIMAFSQIFTLKVIGIFNYIVNFLIGFYLLDIYLFFSYRKQAKLIENELLRAVIIMNNAFKSGKSILQALKIASEELPEPISDEFKKMYIDVKFGLSVEMVFDRFAKRVNLEEAAYIASSLTILNKTGGNIVEVFSSIEKTLFDRKKLNEELKNISASPNMIVKVLLVVPFIFVLFIYMLNPTYFDPLFESPLGYMIIGIIIIMFIIYALLLRRILKVEV